MNIDAAIAQPASDSPLFTLGKQSSTGQIRQPFREVDCSGLDDGDDHPDAGSQVAQMRPGDVLTQPGVRIQVAGMREGMETCSGEAVAIKACFKKLNTERP